MPDPLAIGFGMNGWVRRERYTAELRHPHRLHPRISRMQTNRVECKPRGQTDPRRRFDQNQLQVLIEQGPSARQSTEYTTKVRNTSAHDADREALLPLAGVAPSILHSK